MARIYIPATSRMSEEKGRLQTKLWFLAHLLYMKGKGVKTNVTSRSF